MLQVIIFDVRDGQSILFYPKYEPEYTMLVDIHKTDDFSPVDFIVKRQILPYDDTKGKYVLGNFTLTNYDNDHFSGIVSLLQKVHIKTTILPQNISSVELKNIKSEVTDELHAICNLKDTYIYPVNDYKPPYKVESFYLNKNELNSEEVNTNHLSQIVFVDYVGVRICIAGDLEKPAWEKMLQKEEVQQKLTGTDILVAPHHGRDNGYHENIFKYAYPNVVIISDKELVYGTQDHMAQVYANHVIGDGILFNNSERRKVLTTRNDGHILINIDNNGNVEYRKLDIN